MLPSSPKGAVEDREDDVGAEQAAAGDQLHRRSPRRSSAPSRPIRTSTTSCPASSSPFITEAPELSETSCSEERPPVRTATLTVRAFFPSISSASSGSSSGTTAARLPTISVTSEPGVSSVPPLGDCRSHQPDLFFVARFFFLDHRGEAGGAHFFHRFAAFEARPRPASSSFPARRRRRSARSSPVPVPARRSATGAARGRPASSIPLRRLRG